MDIYIPFTYIIGWSKHKKFYYGAKYAQGCQPSDLWESYFTSSDYVKDFREENGEPDIIRICRTFSDAESCVAFEHKYLTRIDAKNHPNWLNKTNGCGKPGIMDDESKERHKQTCLENYGVDHSSKSPIVKEKQKATYLEAYGVEHNSQIIKPCKHCGELKILPHQALCEKNPNRKLPPKLPFFTIIETKKTYAKNNLSRYFPELKQFF